MVLGYLRRSGPHDEAEDVLQRVFYEVWRHKDRYDPSRSLGAWVLGIANKRAIDHVRRQRRTAARSEELDGIAGEDGRELAERYVRASEVRDALSRLPDEQREVLRLAYFGDCTQTQIAAQLGLPLGNGQGTHVSGSAPPWPTPGGNGLPVRPATSSTSLNMTVRNPSHLGSKL